jgi:hypothetical protein
MICDMPQVEEIIKIIAREWARRTARVVILQPGLEPYVKDVVGEALRRCGAVARWRGDELSVMKVHRRD